MMMKGVAALILFVAAVSAAPVPGGDASWPCFHGPRRDNKSTETGLLQAWPDGGPPLAWKATGLGHGYSSVAVAGGRVFTAGMSDKKTFVVAIDLKGKQLWRKENGESWEASQQQTWAVPYSGARGTPTVDGSVVYHLSELGRLAAFDVATGNELWHLDALKQFRAPRPEYGYSESVLVLGDRLYCCPGGEDGYVVALDKRDGKTIWACTGLKDPVGFGSLVPAEIAGVKQLVGLSSAHIFAVRPDDGKLLWQYAFSNARTNNATDVIVHDGLVFASSGYGLGCVLVRPKPQPGGEFAVEPVWSGKLMDNHHGGVVLLDGLLYGSGHESKGWFCLNFSDGKMRWQSLGKGSLTYADHRLYCLDEKGTMSLVQPAPEKWSVAGSFAVPKGGRGDTWAHPVVCGGLLYIRHSETLYAYRIEAK